MDAEVEIHQINRTLGELKSSVGNIKTSVEVLKEKQKSDRELIVESNKEVNELVKAINTLNTTIATMHGHSEGVSSTVKFVWTLMGGLIIALIIGGSTTIIDLKTGQAKLEAALKAEQEAKKNDNSSD